MKKLWLVVPIYTLLLLFSQNIFADNGNLPPSAPSISLSSTSVDFGQVFEGTTLLRKVVLENIGDEALILGPLSSSNEDFYSFYPGGNTSGGFELNPGDSVNIFIVFEANNLGESSGLISITSSIPTVNINVFGAGVTPPSALITPDSLNEEMNSGDIVESLLTISNTSIDDGADLDYSLSIQFATEIEMMSSSKVFSNVGPVVLNKTNEKNEFTPNQLYSNTSRSQGLKKVANAIVNNTSSLEIEDALVNIKESLQDVADGIIGRYNFSEGEVGNSIGDGGGDMYDGGNHILIDAGFNSLQYSNFILNSTSGSSYAANYFTAKKEGIFTFVGDIEGADSFRIDGGLGADGSGNVKGAMFEVNIAGNNFQVFTKQVYNAGDPSVNHIIIIEDGDNLLQEFSTNTDDDFHRISNLPANARIYYILFAGENGKEFSSGEMEAITASYLNIFSFTPPYLQIDEEFLAGSIPSGSSDIIPLTINSTGLLDSTYFAEFVFTTNDPLKQTISVPAKVKVNGAPGIMVSPNDLNFGNLFVGVKDSLEILISNGGTDELEITSASFSNSAFSFIEEVSLPLSLLPGEELNTYILFAPLIVEDASSTLTLNSNDPNNGTYEVNLLGAGVEPPIAGVNPDMFSYSLNSGDSVSGSFEISNVGGSGLFYEITSRNVHAVSTSSQDSVGTIYFAFENYDQQLNQRRSYIVEYSLNENEIIDTLYSRALENYPITSLAQNNGKLYFNELGTHQISIYNITNADFENEITLESNENSDGFVQSLAHSGDDLYAIVYNTFEGSSHIIKIDESTGNFTDTLGIGNLEETQFISLTINKSENLIYVSNQDTRIRVFDLDAFDQQTDFINNATYRFYNLSYSSSRNSIFAYDRRSAEIIEFDANDASIITTHYIQNLFVHAIATDESPSLSYLEFLSSLADTVAVGSSNQIDFKIRTEGMLGGEYNSEFLVTTNDPLNPEIAIPLELIVVGVPQIVSNKDTLEYGDLFIGASSTQELVFRNSGTDVLEISSIDISDSQFDLVDELSFPISLEINKTLKIGITFVPTESELTNATLTVQSDASSTPSLAISLVGTGVEPPVIALSEESLSYAVDSGDSVSGSFVITNNGNSPLYINLSASTGNSLPEIEAKTKGVSANQSSSISNTRTRIFGLISDFSGTYVAELSYTDGSVLDSILIENISINGPDGLAYDGEFVYLFASSNPDRILKLNPDQNTVTDTLFIVQTGFDALAHSGEFLYALNYSQNEIVKIDTETGEFLSRFTPNTELDIVGGLSFGGSRGTMFASAGTDAVLEIDIQTGEIISDIINPTNTFKAGLGYSDITGTLWIVAQNDENGENTLFEVDPDDGSLINSFPTKASIYALASNETSNPSFLRLFSPEKDTINAGEELTIDFELNAKNLFGGEYNIEFTVASNDPINPIVSLPVEFNVIGIPILSFDSDTLDFGKQIINSNYTKYVTFENIGTGDVIVNNLVVTGSKFFSPSSDTILTISPTKNITYPISFLPSMETGEFTGTLEFSTNITDSSNGIIFFKGEAITGPKISFVKQDLDISLRKGDTTFVDLKIANLGDSKLVVSLSAHEGQSTIGALKSKTVDEEGILVIQDAQSWNTNASSVVNQEFPDHLVNTIPSQDISTENFEDYGLIITVGGQNSGYYSNISSARSKFEEYLNEGGVVLHSVSTFGSTVTLAGGVESIFDNEFHQLIINPDHPILKGLTNDDFISIGNNNYIRNLPDNAEVSLIASQSEKPSFVEYEYGKGYVVVAGVAIEYVHNKSSVVFRMRDFYLKTLRYVSNIELTPVWMSLDVDELSIEPGEEVSFSAMVNPADLDIGNYQSHILASSNILGDSSEVVLVDIDLDVVIGTSTDVESVPTELELSQNYPNPFNPSTNIAYGLPESGNVQMKIFNVLGQQVMLLVDDFKSAGRYSAVFDASQLSSGVYFYKLSVNGKELKAKKMLLLK